MNQSINQSAESHLPGLIKNESYNFIIRTHNHRHILVLNTPQQDEDFSLASLSKLGRLDRVIEMQGKYFESLFNNILISLLLFEFRHVTSN